MDDLATGTTRTFAGAVFIDASYEGDGMAGARGPYRIGRAGRAEYGAQLADVSNFVPLGAFTFQAGNSGFVENSNSKPDGRVVMDGVRWVWLGGEKEAP